MLTTVIGGNSQAAGTSGGAASKGYMLGGYAGSYSSEIDGIDIPTLAAINPAVALPVGRYGAAGTNSSTRGYAMGGGVSGGGAAQKRVDYLSFSDETSGSTSTSISTDRQYSGGLSSAAKGYSLGGQIGSAQQATIDAMPFATETCAAISATLSSPRDAPPTFGSATKGYVAGGINGTSGSQSIFALTYASEAMATLSATLSANRSVAMGVNSATKGYVMGGTIYNSGTGVDTSLIEVVPFATETCSTLNSQIAVRRHVRNGVNNNRFGFGMGGGGDAGPYSNAIDGIDFSTEAGCSPNAVLSVARTHAPTVQSGGFL